MDRKQIYTWLCNKYCNSYEQLLEATMKPTLEKQYGRGGECIHRGYYCPSPVKDILIGNLNRGKLLKTQRSADTADYCFYFDKDKLVMVDEYAVFPERGRVLYSREFILRDGDIEIAPTYEFGLGGSIGLTGISICEFIPITKRLRSSGKLLRYIELQFLVSHVEGMTVMPESVEVTIETYSYNNYGHLVSSYLDQVSRGYTFTLSHCYECDEEGRLLSYKYADEAFTSSPGYEIPESKRRIV